MRDGARARVRELRGRLKAAEDALASDEFEASAKQAAGVDVAPLDESRASVVALRAELEIAERAMAGGDAISRLKAAFREAMKNLENALPDAAMDVRERAARKYRSALQSLHDALLVIELVDDRPLLRRRTEIPDLDPGELAFRSIEPSSSVRKELEQFEPIFDELRQARLDLELR
jgi:hypothetical protein